MAQSIGKASAELGVRLKAAQLRLRELLRYFLVSLVALVADTGTLTLLVEALGWHYLQAAVVGFAVGSGLAFWLSSAWAFDEHAYRHWHTGLLVFTLIGLVGLSVNLGLMWALVQGLGLSYLLAKLLAAVASFLINFTIRKVVLFTIARKRGCP